MQHFKSNGKLLLTAEYLVLDGAKALALPTQYVQSLTVESIDERQIIWKSYNELDEVWFEDTFSIDAILAQQIKPKNSISERLLQIFEAILDIKPNFFNSLNGYSITTTQDFNRKWGLGTSSTLINNVAQWANVNAYTLLSKTFGGSGYDIACAQHQYPLIYQRTELNQPLINKVDFNPSYKDQLYFVYLNKKQNSRDGITKYKTFTGDLSEATKTINTITDAIVNCKALEEFKSLITAHETLISSIINETPIKDKLFSDFNGAIKSLGAWGGDFILVASETNPKGYFTSKGFSTIIPFSKMV